MKNIRVAVDQYLDPFAGALGYVARPVNGTPRLIESQGTNENENRAKGR